MQQADPTDATERRRRAEDDRRLDWRRRDDGLNDLFAFGFTGPDLQAALSRVRDRAHPVGPGDERTAEQRRFDAFKDLLLGRDPLPLDDPHDPSSPCTCASAGGGRAGCGCFQGAAVPCGVELLVHLPIDTALGTSDRPAELVGHGPLDPDLLQALLLAAPRLRPVWTDEHGVVVAVGDRAVVPERADAASVRTALLQLAALPPPPVLHPRHPHDHPPPGPGRGPGIHPAGPPGPYCPSRRLRRLIAARAPRCEWPGCGARASRCDAEHDEAWPDGPTCACNLGPCCRRNHRVKQLGWTKTRSAEGVAWTSPGGGRTWLSPSQHETPGPADRALSPVPAADPLADLSPLEQKEELWWLAGCPDDLAALELRAVEPEEREPTDGLGAQLRTGDTRWLELDDPYAWWEMARPPDPA